MRAEILQASGPGPGHIWTHNGHISPQSITEIILYLLKVKSSKECFTFGQNLRSIGPATAG